MAIHDDHVLPQGLQNARHANLASQRITVRPDMAGKDESLVFVDDVAKRFPIQVHVAMISMLAVSKYPVSKYPAS